MSRVAGLLLAAGLGSRMGAPKALLQWNGRLLVDRGIEVLAAGGCDPVVVVLGAGAEEVRRRADLRAEVVIPRNWLQGMGSSLAEGIAGLEATDAAAVVIALVDQPFVSSVAVRRLIRAREAGASVALAEYDGQPLNPVLLAREHWADVRAAVDGTDRGARQWLSEHPDLVTGVDCTDTGSAEDLDTPADLLRLLSRSEPD